MISDWLLRKARLAAAFLLLLASLAPSTLAVTYNIVERNQGLPFFNNFNFYDNVLVASSVLSLTRSRRKPRGADELFRFVDDQRQHDAR